MTDQSITSLIEKLEGAEVGSRELDHLVFLHTAPMEVSSHWSPTDRMTFFTTSLDASLALLNRVLPGWIWCVAYDDQFSEAEAYRVWVANDRKMVAENPLRSVGARTPALALCAAILRAQSEARV